ncbi:hypothetical protein SAMN05216438_10434 [Lactococcus garvieae]|uniref:Uncharacterized protein n=2 Tax=Lactococcus garvieae TaxID=1363 RepID=A0A1I4GGZ8_9LACT|nr:hypothetical protein SAMN05216438_10434 [Lactococcus garvieae]
MFNDEKLAPELIWELIKDDLEHLPHQKKLQVLLRQEMEYLKAIQSDDVGGTIKSLQLTLQEVSEMDEEECSKALKALIVEFKEAEQSKMNPW